MALDFLEEIYDISKLIFEMKRCVESCNCSDIWLFSQSWNGSAAGIGKLYNRYLANNNPRATVIKGIVDDVRENINNPLLCGGIIEERFIPELYSIAAETGYIDVEEDGYSFTSSKSGLLTIKNNGTGRYWHSTIDPLQEAWDKASLLYAPNVNCIVILGCGLGYLAYQLWKKSYESAHIYIFEPNAKMIDYARQFGVLDWINPEQVTIFADGDTDEMFTKVAKFESDFARSIYFISDWVAEEADENLKQKLIDFTENQKAAIRYAERFDVNYYNNIDLFAGTIADLKSEQAVIDIERNNEYIVVAAGPSLNKQMDYLRSMKGKKTIIAVDGALKKLLANGIKPDYVTALDPNKTLMHYLDGIEDQTKDITLIADSVVYWQYVGNYKGPVYRVCSSDSKLNIVDREKYDIPNLGYHGTVSGLAIEEAAYFGAKIIELIGLDLAFPGGQHHADGIGVDTSIKMNGNIMVPSVTGEPVGTNATFEKFIREIEIQVAEHPEIIFNNLSDCGAYIKGTFCGRWYETLPAICDAKGFFDRLVEDSLLSCEEKYHVIRQFYHRLKKDGMSDQEIFELNIFTNVYADLAKEYLSKIKIDDGIEKNSNNEFVLLITSHFCAEDATTKQLLGDAYKFQNTHGIKVIIINTNEYLGGRKVALRDATMEVEKDVVLNDQIIYLGGRYSYVDCDSVMPDAEYIERICNTFASYNIRGIISYDPMSIFAEACRKIGLVEYRFCYFVDSSTQNAKNLNIKEAKESQISEKAFALFTNVITVMEKGKEYLIEYGTEILKDVSDYEFDKKDIADLKALFHERLISAVKAKDAPNIVLCYSYLFKLNLDIDYLVKFLDYLLETDAIEFIYLDFIYKQIVAEIFLHSELKNFDVDIRMQRLLEKCVRMAEKGLSADILEPIDKLERDEDFVLVITSQFVGLSHGPTKSALDRCSILKNELKKKVMLINTAELMQIVGYMPFYAVKTPNYCSELSNLDKYEWRDTYVPFYQCDFGMPRVDIMVELLRFIRKNKPQFVLEIGTGSIFAALVNKIVPVLSDAMVPSQIGYFSTEAVTCAKVFDENDYRYLDTCGIDRNRVIQNSFSWKLKPSVETRTRAEVGIPKEAFCIALVGARLDVELTDEFLDFLENTLCDNYCYMLLGRCVSYESKLEKHPKLKGHTIFPGFVSDTQSYLRLCDVYLNPLRNGGGFSCVEAMISGVPVVTLNYGDVAVAAGSDFCCKDMNDVATTIAKYKENRELYEAMSAKAKERALALQDSEGFFGNAINEFVKRFV